MVINHCQNIIIDTILKKALNTLAFKRTNTTWLTRPTKTYLWSQALIKMHTNRRKVIENGAHSKIPTTDQKQDLPSLNQQFKKLDSWPGSKVSSSGTSIHWSHITLYRESEYSFCHTWKGLSPIAQFFAISPKKFIGGWFQTSFSSCPTTAAVFWMAEVLIDMPLQHNLYKKNLILDTSHYQQHMISTFIGKLHRYRGILVCINIQQ